MVLIASTFNHGGMFAEKPGGALSCEASHIRTLGKYIKQKLDECEYKADFNHSRKKKSDWPAYKESGFKTMKAFESNFIPYRIQGANEANIIWQIASPPLRNGIELHSYMSVSASAAEIGEWVLNFHDFFLKTEKVAQLSD